ncbi:hypothetical protein [Methylorubrum salsuginis]|uniref:Uncharacterized protein n=1 Tax=Methylorubrum salsuginis TaxID=414703 RepID=A0A1I4L7K4_9HYPH|nr:hypothetical protein [Methylorubrum salsuginis]SFL86859.1 hypothetical protein SAMN04488125_1287 [Methylorubrum salsuginis]
MNVAAMQRALIADPNTAAQVTILVSGGGAALVSILGGVEKPSD